MNCIAFLYYFYIFTGCYILSETDSISMLPTSDYARTEQQFMQLGSTFADVYFKDVSVPVESICYLGLHA